jgi:cytochrome c peroxidase
VLGVVPVGHGPSAIALSHDGQQAYVWNQFDGSVTEFALPHVATATQNSRFAGTPDEQMAFAMFTQVETLPARTFNVVEDALPAQVSLGRKLFHDATDSRISQGGAISCASCHPDGRADGRTWNFTFGPRNTPQLGGGILDTAPFHWPGDVETVNSLNEMTVLAFMGGDGLDADHMAAIGSFIDQIRKAPSASEAQGALTLAEARGKEIFEDATVGCTSCHAGADFTDNLSWNVGTKSLDDRMSDIEQFQTPVLHGLNRSAPYLHDGSAATLEDLVEHVVRRDQMGQGSHLTDAEADDLVAYLKSL